MELNELKKMADDHTKSIDKIVQGIEHKTKLVKNWERALQEVRVNIRASDEDILTLLHNLFGKDVLKGLVLLVAEKQINDIQKNIDSDEMELRTKILQ